ncbi:MAG: carotenoid biosynthesis protein [Candidatus Thorarchaeota archaeon]
MLPLIIGSILCGLAMVHAFFDGRGNHLQRSLMLATLFLYGILLEYIGIISGHHYYAPEVVMIFGVVPLSIPLSWVGIIYSATIIAERLRLNTWARILTTTSIALSLDWGMDPIAVQLGLWTWIYEGGSFFGIPSFNFIGWFFIPIAFLISYNLNWSKETKKIQILSIYKVDDHNSIQRRFYTIFLVVPIGLSILIILSLITLIPVIYNLPVLIIITLEVISIAGASIVIVKRKERLKRRNWFDIIPSSILLFIAYSYALLGFLNNQVILGLFMILTAIPLLLAFCFTLFKQKE